MSVMPKSKTFKIIRGWNYIDGIDGRKRLNLMGAEMRAKVKFPAEREGEGARLST